MSSLDPDEADEDATLAALDQAVRAHAASDLNADGEVIVSWMALAAVRRYDGGGFVISMPSGTTMPYWEARGILHEALAMLERMAIRDDEGGN